LRVRLLAALVTVVAGLAILELSALAAFRVLESRGFSYKRHARLRAEVIAKAQPITAARATARPVGQHPAGVEGRPERTAAELVLHPYLGFVYDPESPWMESSLRNGGLQLSEHGFFVLPRPAGTGPEWTVATFGGSLAAQFSVDGRRAMTEALAASPHLRGRRIRYRSFALGGFKQPQMAQALAYLLSLGERFDAVVELDGFNDIAVSSADHRATGKFPFYPRDWEGLAAASPSVDDLRRLGAIALLQERRAEQARLFGRKPLRWSVAASLVWRGLDRRLSRQISAAREVAATQRAQAGGYRVRGPVRQYASDEALLRDIAAVWGRSSLQMHRLCAGAGIVYHHFLQPNQYVPGSKPMSAAEKALAFQANHPYRPAVERGYPLMQAEGKELARQGVAFTDLVPLFSSVSEPIYSDACCHVNQAGNDALGRRIGTELAADLARRP
jgi:hypothetical protein